ncbi:MAG TPA: hypothetical protein VHG51_10185 [Longimicrobiaceae bacterium]|nr:hypothetical protein [Longimicrobiaceae bacterium]
MSGRKQLVRDFRAGQYLDLFLVSAVSAILGIRLFLHLAGYPQVGGDSLHVAHMLWGGLLMLAALVVLLSYLGRRSHQLAAVLGGLGFGTFIDEVGKFVTQDNDYFYRPAVALIYLSFVALYMATRSIHGRPPSAKENLVNALQELEDVAFDDLDRAERERALLYLERAGPADPLARTVAELIRRTEPIPTPDPHPLQRLRDAAVRLYRRTAARPWFPRAIVLFFVAQLAAKAGQVLAVVFWPERELRLLPTPARVRRIVEGLTVAEWAQLASALLAAVLVALGIALFRGSRLRAFRMFQRSILLSIFVTQVFMFYRDQWAALLGLAFNLAVLAALNFAIEQESLREASRQHAAAHGPGA